MITVTPKLVAKLFQVLFDQLKEAKTITLKQLTSELRTLGGNELAVAAILNGFYKYDQKYLNDENLSVAKSCLDLKVIDYRALTMMCYDNNKNLYPVWMQVGDLNADQDIMRTVNNHLTVMRAQYGPKLAIKPATIAETAKVEPVVETKLVSALELRTVPAMTPSQSGGSEEPNLSSREAVSQAMKEEVPEKPRRTYTRKVQQESTTGPKSLGDLVRAGLSKQGTPPVDPEPTVELPKEKLPFGDIVRQGMDVAGNLDDLEPIPPTPVRPRTKPIRSMGEAEIRLPAKSSRRLMHEAYYQAMIERLSTVLFRCALKGDTITFEDLAAELQETKPTLSRVLRMVQKTIPDNSQLTGLLRSLLVFIEKGDGQVPYWFNKNMDTDISYAEYSDLRYGVKAGTEFQVHKVASSVVNEIEIQQAADATQIKSMQMAVRGTISALLTTDGAEQYEHDSIMNDEFRNRHGATAGSFYLQSSRYEVIVCHLLEASDVDASQFMPAKKEFWTSNGYVQAKKSSMGTRYADYYRAFPVPHLISIKQ